MKNFNTADVCEEAHAKTIKECKKKNININKYNKKDGDLRYTDEAQDIFNKHFDIVEQSFINNNKK